MKHVSKYIDAIKAEITFVIGGNAQENFDIIDEAKQQDLWFHVGNDMPSEHIIASIPTNLSKKQIGKIATQGAVLCKQYSKYASQKNLAIIYTQVKDISKTETIGCVIAQNQKTIII